MRSKLIRVALLLAAIPAVSARAQTPLRLPQASPAASAAETIGITEVEIRNHPDEAIAYLEGYAAKHSDSRELWRVYTQLGDVYNGKKDRARAEWDGRNVLRQVRRRMAQSSTSVWRRVSSAPD